MKGKSRIKDILFGLYFLSVILLAIIYFTVPERGLFIENQLQWWNEMWEILKG